MTDTLVDIEWIGGPLDGRITRQLRADLRPGMVAWHEEAGVRNNYRLECESKPEEVRCVVVFRGSACGYKGPALKCDKTFQACRDLGNAKRFAGMPLGHPTERWVYRHVKAKGRRR